MKKLYALLAVVAMMGAVNAQNWTLYDCSVLPENAFPVWGLGDKGTVYAQYSVTDGVLMETSTGDDDKLSYKLKITQPVNATWMFKLKAGEKKNSPEFEINTKDASGTVYRINLKLYNDGASKYIGLNYTDLDDATFPSAKDFSVTDWHIYRITIKNGKEFSLYVDENVTPVLTGNASTSTQTQFLRFGDFGSTLTEGYIDWMAWEVETGYAPGEGTNPTAVKEKISNLDIVSVEYFTLTGVASGSNYEALPAGVYIQKSTYANGAVESVKISKSKK